MGGCWVSPEAHARRTGWIEVLDELEADLVADQALLERAIVPTNPTVWTPPSHLGAIPIALRDRATRILVELGTSSQRMMELRHSTGQQLAAVRSIPSAQRPEQAIYLDVTG